MELKQISDTDRIIKAFSIAIGIFGTMFVSVGLLSVIQLFYPVQSELIYL